MLKAKTIINPHFYANYHCSKWYYLLSFCHRLLFNPGLCRVERPVCWKHPLVETISNTLEPIRSSIHPWFRAYSQNPGCKKKKKRHQPSQDTLNSHTRNTRSQFKVTVHVHAQGRKPTWVWGEQKPKIRIKPGTLELDFHPNNWNFNKLFICLLQTVECVNSSSPRTCQKEKMRQIISTQKRYATSGPSLKNPL